MSSDLLTEACRDNPELAEELRNAKAPRERHAIPDRDGIEGSGLDSRFPEAGGWHRRSGGNTISHKLGEFAEQLCP